MKEKTINIDGINITLLKRARVRNINISIKPLVGVRVVLPIFSSFRRAEKLVHNKMVWIKKHFARMKDAEKNYTIFNFDTDFRTRDSKLFISSSDSARINYFLKNGIIHIHIPSNMHIFSVNVQQEIRKIIESVWRKEAKMYLPNRLKELADLHGLTYNKVSVRNTKTRWGSCSYHNNISLNLHLMRLPDHLIDYVLLHELAHTKVKNHSIDFWSYLEKLMKGSRGFDKELKKFNILIW